MAILWAAGKDTETVWPLTPADGGGWVSKPRPTYQGAVLGSTGRVERIMSDVWEHVSYAVVWDGERVREVAVSTDGWKADGTVVVDATPEVLAAVEIWKAAEAVKAEALAAARRKADAEYEARKVTKGKVVVVARGRKVAKGTTGAVIWMGEGKWGWRVGVKDDAGEVHWTALSNVEVADPSKYLSA